MTKRRLRITGRPHGVCLFMCVSALLFAGRARADEPTAEQIKFFEMKVRPLLVESCLKCHGPDKQESDLRLDSREAALAGGENGPAVVPGQPDESGLVEAINHDGLEMPPDEKLPEGQIALLTEWVKMGAPWPKGDAAGKIAPKSKITDDDRDWWAYQPVRRPAVPEVNDNGWSRNEIDRFVFRRLAEAGIQPAPEADPRTLIRRAYFDLIGLPPSAEEIAQFEKESTRNPQSAFRNLIDRLLESPRYGERWARHWLDLVRYAESDGYKADGFRPHAWRYRDYVIRALNDDKPYDRFVMEQLAGDEIAPDDPDAIVATAYLRHWIYEYNQRDVRTQWTTILNDVTDVTADVFLGTSLGCARCHDHKFDPILRRDYYRMQAFFTPMLPRDDLPLGDDSQLAEYRTKLAEWEAATAEIRRQIEAIEKPHFEKAARPAISKFPRDIRPMLSKPVAERVPFEHQIADLAFRQVTPELEKLDMKTKLKGEEKARWEALRNELEQYDHLKPQPLPPAFTVTDVGPVAPPTEIPGAADGAQIAPGYFTVLDESDAEIVPPASAQNSTGRRAALARWIASPDNPLSTRVVANRIWQYHFGHGITRTSSDFGHLGEPPSHPELLDWLTSEFVDRGWSFKQMHRLIMTSATYRQSSRRPAPEVARLNDPENRLLWRMDTRRLDAEQIRDAILAVSGQLDLKMGGPSVDTKSPRRTIYTRVIRNRRDPLLDVFDAADNFNSTSQRNVTTTAPQSLLMINGPWTLARAKVLASRLEKQRLPNDRLVDAAYRSVFGRPADDEEKAAAMAFLTDQSLPAEANAADDGPADLTATMPHRDSPAIDLQSGDRQQRLELPDNPSLPAGDFTVEAIVLLRSLYEDATVRTIAAQWDSDTNHAGWAFGVTSTKSKYQPRNLILQLVGDPAKGGGGYEVIASDLRPELDKPYYLAASVRIGETGPEGITFYMKDLSRDGAPLEKAQAAHKVSGHYRSSVPFTIGGRANTNRHFWDGLVDEMRLTAKALAEDQLLLHQQERQTETVGHWTFDAADQLLADSASKQHHLNWSAKAASSHPAVTSAFVDFCHVLLNANEFIYVD